MIAVVIPCYKVGLHVCDVIARIGEEVARIYVVDDACPHKAGDLVEATCTDARVTVLRNTRNLGVGGAVTRGYRQALTDGASVVVKLDGDMQVDPALIPELVKPILRGEADYRKGNRFARSCSLKNMPAIRRVANRLASTANRWLTGFTHINDSANGFTAILSDCLRQLPLNRLDKGYFFESDMLYRLSRIGARVSDMPMDAVYGQEQSGVNIRREWFNFGWKYLFLLAGKCLRKLPGANIIRKRKK